MRMRVLRGPLRATCMDLSPTREKSFWSGRYERSIQNLVAALPLHGVAWDIGAHIGFFTLLLAKRCHVIAVEPNPDNAQRLRRNVTLNRANVEVIQAAVGASRGAGRLALGPTSGTHRLAGIEAATWLEPGGGLIDVSLVTLDSLLDYGHPSFVKIDIEGAEVQALPEARRLLQEHPMILCETHGEEARRDVPRLLQDHDYKIRWLDADRLFAMP
jgi:FkbM family methyltransferase